MARKRIVALTWLKNSFLPFALYILLHKCQSTTTDMGDSLPVGTSLVGNQALVSKNGTFALGFFSPQNTNNWYIGIWYAKVSEKTFVWVANRENPVRNIPGVLNLSRDGYLRLFDLRGRLIWSSDNSLRASRASLLESGNLVMLRTRAGKVWECFQHPVDTWLPGMKMRKGMKFTSWKSSSDPAPGPFYLQMDPSPASTQFLVFSHNSGPYWSSGEWNGKYFANMPGFASAGSHVKIVCVTLPPSRMYCTYTTKGMIMERLSLKKNGELWVYYMIQNGGWMLDAFGPRDQCIVYGVCGANAACIDYRQLNAHVTGNANDTCTCLQGFSPQNSHACPLQCSLTNSNDGFLEVKDKLLADDEAAAYSKEQTLSGCQLACLNNCSCMAFWLSSSSLPVCRLWFGDLMNVRDSPGGQPFYLRLAASELQGSTSKPRNKSFGLHILLPVGAAGFVLVLVLAVHKLGRGSLGSVFKGTLADKTFIVVKKLEGLAGTEKQFRAEISTIGEIQHVNLVRLFGFCAEESRRPLVYEYMPNGSLDSFLLRGKEGEVQGKILSWKTRFQIALGTARGLAYLHDECRDRIIHCDIKPENILLDADFCPKVADFGLAK
ncbi:G-type lectin S-receptor-like serine/threonine-protein kinase At2g19130 [Cryptomeria japonica]|uniref:G-type lectin S-receptor-like serine/threonine-protein kinase At2g19130 n=1 Tax=Cryptomeria japonica TaxID=3369 RepID=UPI0027DA7D04|nr:G-type lectin S-receptor-like serine/threonine-protein kinase At2g19130 [Cryptomeria japonica]